MAVIEKDLGPVSAYAVAVAHGYTGTEAEWEALIANSAINAQSAGASATAAAASAQEAAQQKTQAQAQAAAALAHAQDASRFSQTAGQANSYAQMASSNAAHSATNASNAQTAAEAAQAAAEAAVTGAEAAQTAAEAAVTDAQTAKTAAETAAATAAAAYGTDLLADDYSTSKTYAVGDYVIYSGNLYRCTTAIATAESWTAAHWTQAQVGPDLNDLKSAFVDTTEITRNLFDKYTITPGNIDASGNITASTTIWYSDFIDVSGAFAISSTAKPSDSVVRIAYYNDSKVFQNREVVGVNDAPTRIIRGSNTYKYIRVACANDFENALQIERGGAVTAYIPHRISDDITARAKANEIDYYNDKSIPAIWYLTAADVGSGNVSASNITFTDNAFSFGGTTGDDYWQTYEITLEGETQYTAEVFCDSDNFEVHLLANYGSGNTFTQFTGGNKERAYLEFTTPSSGIIRFRFSNKIANTSATFAGFKVYKKTQFIEELYTNGYYPYVSDKRINFTITGVNGDTIPCTLMLPTTYSDTGEPVELALLCHGSGMKVSKTEWIGTLLKLPKAIVNAGIAVFDCNGYSPSDGNSWGCPAAMQNYLKAYEYVTTHYNVKKHIHVCGLSMGGLVALNFVTWYPSIIKDIGIMSPVVDLYNEGWLWPTGGRKEMISTAYGFAGTTTYESEKTVGCDPMLRALEIGNAKYIPILAPLKIWQGTADTAVDPALSTAFYNYVRNAGNYAEYYSVENGVHEIWGDDTVNASVANWFSSF